ncbi:MMPL family transporter [Shouchella lonarensis]|uniref:Putative drug exporter of the RND superfamily n=1 Tax=Shouchella lonarensis TaxID=1464122 RepID=A0A1G6HN60_9BACI|nr:MMPL family transporter [Shouchella lonarensis]SDB94876.1 putative drug exporter of the RND superfamily [Shouchella lonarensis]
MKRVFNGRVLLLLLWVVLSVVSVLTLPDMGQLSRDKGDIRLPDSAQSIVARDLLQHMDDDNDETYDVVVVWHSGNNAALTAAQREEVDGIVRDLENKEELLGITKMTTHLDSEDIAAQLTADDETTVLTQLSVAESKGTIAEVREQLREVIDPEQVDVYLTGAKVISEDFASTTEDGIKKTEMIAVVFIIVVLVLVFRSPIVPLVSLLTVGVSYIVSLAIIANAVLHVDFPFSSFTQVFLIVILFGVGTDYNILLYTRFKEELSHTDDAWQAAKATIRTSGKTVVYSGLAVFIGFVSLALAEFTLYQAMSAVAIGVGVLVLVLTTLNPFFMALLGKKMFWPSKHFAGHGDSKMWAFLSHNAALRPVISIALVALLTVPFLWQYRGDVHYNDLLEVADHYESKQGINVIEDHFSSGFAAPATVVIDTEKRLDEQLPLRVLDELTEALSKVDGVSEVYSATRPTGERINGLYIDEQTGQLQDGLHDAGEGAFEIGDGLSEAEKKLADRDENGADHVQALIDGTGKAQTGATEVGKAVDQLAAGISEGAEGAQTLKDGLASLEENLALLQGATSELHAGYTELEQGLSGFGTKLTTVSETVSAALRGWEDMSDVVNDLLAQVPNAGSNAQIQDALAAVKEKKAHIDALSSELTQASQDYNEAMTSFRTANAALSEVNSSLTKMKDGAEELKEGAATLQTGLSEGASGSKELSTNTAQLASGLGQIKEGQTSLQTALTTLSEQMGALQDGLHAGSEGLNELRDGLADAEGFLGDLSGSAATHTFFVPDDVLTGDRFQASLDAYMSPNRETTKLTVILETNPYTVEAMDVISEVNETAAAALQGTVLDEATVAVGGQSAINADLREVASGDFLRTAVLMLVGIGIFLVIITRSVKLPIFIIGLLAFAYMTSLAVTEIVSKYLLGVEALSWNVPFFGFILLVAIGVDYSIFLLMRYNELPGDPLTAMKEAARHIGGVVISAAIILGGTFAALYPSGVLTLIQVATLVIVGLALLSVLLLPVMLPGLMRLDQILVRWSGRKRDFSEKG